MMMIAITRARQTNPDIELGICGEHGRDPESIKICYHELKLDYVSPSGDGVYIARLVAAQAVLEERKNTNRSGDRPEVSNRGSEKDGQAANKNISKGLTPEDEIPIRQAIDLAFAQGRVKEPSRRMKEAFYQYPQDLRKEGKDPLNVSGCNCICCVSFHRSSLLDNLYI